MTTTTRKITGPAEGTAYDYLLTSDGYAAGVQVIIDGDHVADVWKVTTSSPVLASGRRYAVGSTRRTEYRVARPGRIPDRLAYHRTRAAAIAAVEAGMVPVR